MRFQSFAKSSFSFLVASLCRSFSRLDDDVTPSCTGHVVTSITVTSTVFASVTAEERRNLAVFCFCLAVFSASLIFLATLRSSDVMARASAPVFIPGTRTQSLYILATTWQVFEDLTHESSQPDEDDVGWPSRDGSVSVVVHVQYQHCQNHWQCCNRHRACQVNSWKYIT